MTKVEILNGLKNALKITDKYHDGDLNVKIDDTIEFLKLKGISETNALTKYPGLIRRGASDLYNYDKYEALFNDMLCTALLEEGITNNA